MGRCLALVIAVLPLAAPAQEDTDRVVLAQRDELTGKVVGHDADGSLRIQTTGGQTVRVPIERVQRVVFGKPGAVQSNTQSARVQFFHGTIVTGTADAIQGDDVTVTCLGGALRVRRGDIKLIVLAVLKSPPPEIKDEKKDFAVREIEKKEGEKTVTAAVVEYGEVVSLDKDHLVMKVGGAEQTFPRATLRQIQFKPADSPRELSAGWFAKLILKNGDRVVGVLSSVDDANVVVFSHILGSVKVAKKQIHSMSFMQYARTTVGNFVVCDQSGVKEYDRNGRSVVFEYTNNVQYAWAAVKLENGNLLIANTNYNQVIEVNPQKEIVWRIDSANYPYDVQRLENGNTLVAEYYGNRVSEFDSKGNRKWSCTKIMYPVAAQRLENGNTLITGNNQVIEVDVNNTEVWRLKADRVKPWRAMRLENGNTLVTDYQRGMVVEYDSAGKEVWKKDGLSRPMGAVRTEDGNTLILEQGANRVIEVDPAKATVNEYKGLLSPQGLSTY